jgi:O-antigen/teichoic acid export membrane protein
VVAEARDLQPVTNPYAAEDPLLPDELPLPPGTSPAPPAPEEPAPIRLQALGGYATLFAALTLLSKGVSFFMLPLYARYLSPADYGVIELIENSLDILQIVAGSRLLGGVFRFYYKTDDQTMRRRVVSTAMLTIYAGYACAALIAYILAPLLARYVIGDIKYTGLARLASANLAVVALYFVPPVFLRLTGRFTMLVRMNLIRLPLQVAMNILFLVHFHMGPAAIFLSTLICNVVVGGIMTWMVFREVGFAYDKQVAKDLYRYGAPLIVTQFATFILTYGDRPFLRVVTNLTSVGLYTMAYSFAFLLAYVAQTPFDLVWEPKKFEIAKRADRDSIYARVFVYQNVTLLTLAVAMSLSVHGVLRIMATPPFYPAANVVPILLIAMIFQAWTASQDVGIGVSEKTKYIAIANWISAGVVLIAYALLIPRYAGWGAAIATAIAYGVRYGCTYAFSQRLWPIRYNWTPVLRLAALSVVTVVVSVLVPAHSLVMAVAARVTEFAVFLALMWWLPILSASDKRALLTLPTTISASVRARLRPAVRAT